MSKYRLSVVSVASFSRTVAYIIFIGPIAESQLKFTPKDERISWSSLMLEYAGFSNPHTLPASRNNVLVISKASRLKSIFVSIDVK